MTSSNLDQHSNTVLPAAVQASADNAAPENLYHIILTTSHIHKDPNSQIEKVRIAATYTNLAAAKAAAHRCLFDAGYEREWFTEYETKPEFFESHNLRQRTGLAVLAVAPDGTTFRVRVSTTPNRGKFTTDYEDGWIPYNLYHVVQTNVFYADDESGEVRDTNIEGSFKTYEEARQCASRVLLSEEDGITKESFAEYDEAGLNERDCGYGENVVVHAVGNNGENILVSVIKSQTMESVRLAEAAMRIR